MTTVDNSGQIVPRQLHASGEYVSIPDWAFMVAYVVIGLVLLACTLAVIALVTEVVRERKHAKGERHDPE